MTPVRFPLCLDRLDDRIVPSIADALDAANFVELAEADPGLGAPPRRDRAETGSRHDPHGIFRDRRRGVRRRSTLSAFLSEVQTTIAANPGNTSLYTLANRTWDEIALARLEYSYANTFASSTAAFRLRRAVRRRTPITIRTCGPRSRN